VPILELGMRLGEASGAALAMPIVAGAIAAFREMASFETAGVDGQC
jgi:nicotinate-nucleotide--dimethylbenzimidazole phosphoribosyltransferase